MDRSRVGPWTRRRLGFSAGALALGVAAIGRGAGTQAAKKKRKKRRCPKPPKQTCPASCGFRYFEAGGGTICGTGALVKQVPCTPCTASSQCTDAAFPQCVTDFRFLSGGERQQLGVCQPYTNGLCSAVIACVT